MFDRLFSTELMIGYNNWYDTGARSIRIVSTLKVAHTTISFGSTCGTYKSALFWTFFELLSESSDISLLAHWIGDTLVYTSPIKSHFLLFWHLDYFLRSIVNRSFRNYWIISMKNTYSYYSELWIYFFSSLQLHFTSYFYIITSSKSDFFLIRSNGFIDKSHPTQRCHQIFYFMAC